MRVRKIERMQYWVHPIYSCYNFMLISAFLSAYFYFARNAIHMIQYKIEFPETINRTLRRICAKRIFVGRQWAINRLGIGRKRGALKRAEKASPHHHIFSMTFPYAFRASKRGKWGCLLLVKHFKDHWPLWLFVGRKICLQLPFVKAMNWKETKTCTKTIRKIFSHP